MTLKNSTLEGLGATPGEHFGPQMVHQMGDIGRMVRRQRKDQGLRIDDAAALSGVSVDLLSRLENGKGTVGLEKVLSVLDGLGLCLVVTSLSHPALRTLVRAGASDESAPAAGFKS